MTATQESTRKHTPAPKAPGLDFPASHRGAKSFDHGGAIRGPGTPTSDSVPIFASNGEFMLPADTTAAVGKENLQALVNATHTPFGGALRKKGMVAKANGGLIDPIKQDPAPPALGVKQIGSVSIPAPLPMLTASLAPSSQAVQLAANEATAAKPASAPAMSPVSAMAPQQSGAAFGIYPNPNSRLSSHANDNALARGVTAAGPSKFQPATPLSVAPLRLTNLTDPRSTEFAGGARQPMQSGAGSTPAQVPPAAIASPAIMAPAAVPQAVNPADASVAGAAAPSGAVRRVGNSYSGTDVSGDITVNGSAPRGNVGVVGDAATPGAPGVGAPGYGGRPFALGSAADTNMQLANLQASNAAVPIGGVTIMGDGGARQATQDFFTDASQRNELRAAQGAAGGPKIQAALVAQAQGAINNTASNRARNATELANTELREAGEFARLGVRELGADRRAAMADSRNASIDALARERFGLERTATGFTTRSAERVEKAQNDVLNAKTPDERRTAMERLQALTGKAAADKFTATTIGGGTEPIDPTNPMLGVRTVPSSALVTNSATGETRLVRADGAGATPQAVAPPQGAVAELKANPALAAKFDQKYGAGASARALSTK